MFKFLKHTKINDLNDGLKSWPFEEAKKIVKTLAIDQFGGYKTPKKGYVLFETGYGPSGLPHIGTFSEVFRMACIRKAFVILTKGQVPTKLLAVSDDVDAIRKVPDNIPEESKVIIKKYLGVALNSVPNPFKKEKPRIKSFSDYGNYKLKSFLKNIGFRVENFLEDGQESKNESHFNLNVCCFLSATEAYKCGLFNNGLIEAAKKYEDLLNIMLPTLGPERQATYSPFMPIHSDENIKNFVIQHGVISVDSEKYTVKYSYNDKIYEKSFLNGGCKLQWKCDFGMRMAVLGVNYEFYGKDHWPNDKIYRSISHIICNGHEVVTSFYELFLDEEGKKISKSKGNGTDVDVWFKYSSKEVLAYYMYLKPQTAKRLYFDIIPRVTDECLLMLVKYQEQNYIERCNNPIFFVYNALSQFGDRVPVFKNEISYSLLLTLAFICRAENQDILIKMIKKYTDKRRDKINSNFAHDIRSNKICVLETEFDYSTNKTFLGLAKSAVNYYHDFFKSKSVNYVPVQEEKKMITVFIDKIKKDEEKTADSLQNIAYEVGKSFSIDLKNWFALLYKVSLGLEHGPRIGSLIAIYGFDKFIQILEDKGF